MGPVKIPEKWARSSFPEQWVPVKFSAPESDVAPLGAL